MLTTAEEDRLEEALPTADLEVAYEGNTHQYDLNPFWWGGDDTGDDVAEPPEYPAIVFQFETQNQPETARQPANDLHSIDNPADEPGLTETEVEEVSDDLSMTVVVEARHDNGIPPQVRSSQLTRQVWRFVRFELGTELNTVGPNGERAIRPALLSAPTPARVKRTLRSSWSVRLHHAETHDVEVETAKDVEVTVEQTDN